MASTKRKSIGGLIPFNLFKWLLFFLIVIVFGYMQELELIWWTSIGSGPVSTPHMIQPSVTYTNPCTSINNNKEYPCTSTQKKQYDWYNPKLPLSDPLKLFWLEKHNKMSDINDYCWIWDIDHPKINIERSKLWIRDYWFWPDFSHFSLIHERVNLCYDKHPFLDLYGYNFTCRFNFSHLPLDVQRLIDNDNMIYNVNVTLPKRIHFAQNIIVDCPVPDRIQSLLFKYYYLHDTDTVRIRTSSYSYLSIMNKNDSNYIEKNIFNSKFFVQPSTQDTIENQTNYDEGDGSYAAEGTDGGGYFIKSLNKSENFLGFIDVYHINNESVSVPLCQQSLLNYGELYQPQKQYFLSACTVITSDIYTEVRQNETILDTKYRLREWIEYHLMIGIEHFYIYDNSKEPYGFIYKTIILINEEYNSNIITYIYWPHSYCDMSYTFDKENQWRKLGSQMSAFGSCLGKFGWYNEWIAMFDVDEYLIPSNKLKTIDNTLKYWNKQIPNLNTVSFLSRLGLECSKLNNWYNDSNSVNKITYFSKYQCTRLNIEFNNRKPIVKPSVIRSTQIHFPIYTYDNMFRKEKILNDTNDEGYLFHARSGTKYQEYIKRGKNVSVSIHDDKYPYIKYLSNLMQKLNKRIGKKYFQKSWNDAQNLKINLVSSLS